MQGLHASLHFSLNNCCARSTVATACWYSPPDCRFQKSSLTSTSRLIAFNSSPVTPMRSVASFDIVQGDSRNRRDFEYALITLLVGSSNDHVPARIQHVPMRRAGVPGSECLYCQVFGHQDIRLHQRSNEHGRRFRPDCSAARLSHLSPPFALAMAGASGSGIQ